MFKGECVNDSATVKYQNVAFFKNVSVKREVTWFCYWIPKKSVPGCFKLSESTVTHIRNVAAFCCSGQVTILDFSDTLGTSSSYNVNVSLTLLIHSYIAT